MHTDTSTTCCTIFGPYACGGYIHEAGCFAIFPPVRGWRLERELHPSILPAHVRPLDEHRVWVCSVQYTAYFLNVRLHGYRTNPTKGDGHEALVGAAHSPAILAKRAHKETLHQIFPPSDGRDVERCNARLIVNYLPSVSRAALTRRTQRSDKKKMSIVLSIPLLQVNGENVDALPPTWTSSAHNAPEEAENPAVNPE